MIALGLSGIGLLAVIISSLQVWLSQTPAWTAFKTSLAMFLCSLLLLLILLGKEFSWWHIDGDILDKLGIAWIGVTLVVTVLTYWLVRPA